MNVVTGVHAALPGAGQAAELLSGGPSGTPVDPAETLGKKGLRYKDRATRLGLAAAQLALRDARLLDERNAASDPAMAVVVSSNFGNVDTVCRVAQTISEETTRGVSPMDTANASSNVIASEVAIRFGLRGPNLMLCNGATSGLDAMRWADVLLRGGRANRVLVLGVEPDNEMVRKLSGRDKIIDGGAAVVVETAESARERDARVRARLARCVRATGVAACLERLAAANDRPRLWFVPERGSHPLSERLLAGVPRQDLSARWGAASGALGVLQCVASVGWFDDGGAGEVHAVAGNDEDDGTAGVVLMAAGESG